jgi:serine/threonine protein kinase
MVTLLRDLHNTNIIHRDIKPENFVVHENKIHLIDFGLSKLYIQDNKHIEYRENKGMIGTARYASINSLKGNEQSRRDDLESVGYLLIYLYMGALPWNNIVTEDK